MMLLKLSLVALVVVLNLVEINGHGMMMDPVNRSSAWRKGFKTPPNYTDNEHYCGGFARQWNANKGKCGECGDDYSLPRPRSNENGGTYGTGTIVKTYKSGSTVNFTVKLSANHMGTFNFHACPLSKPKELETDACFSKYPIKIANTNSYEWKIPKSGSGEFVIPVVLPAGLKCDHCVIRWNYRTANNWGICEDGRGAVGCGPQEHFRSCADVKITA